MTDVPPDTPLMPEPEAPAAPLTIDDATAAWVSAPEAPAPIRNEDGTFAAATPPETPPAEPEVAPDTPAPTAEDPAQFIEAKVGEEVVKLRKDTLIPTKRNGQVEYEPLEVVQRERMLKKDYDAGRQEIKAERQRMAAERAALQHRAAAFEREEARIREATTDPEKFEAYQEHLRLYQTNPAYKEMVDQAQRVTDYEAAQAANQSVQEQAAIEEAVTTATGWIAEAVGRHPGVDVDTMAVEFGRALRAGTPGVNFSPESIEAFVAARAKSTEAVLTPLQQQLAAQQAELAKVQAELAALRATKTTDHALQRARSVPTAPVGGAAPIPGRQTLTTPNGARDLDSLTQAWKRS